MPDIKDANENIAAIIAEEIEQYYGKAPGGGSDFEGVPTRTFKRILKGDLALNETLFYELQKYDQNNKLLQKIFLPVGPFRQYTEFYDSQVKYGKFYRYKIFAWQLIHGTRYKYRNIEAGTIKGVGASIPALNSLFGELKTSFSKLQDVANNGFFFFEQNIKLSSGKFKNFATEMNGFMRYLVGLVENPSTTSQSVWWRTIDNPGNIGLWPDFVEGWASEGPIEGLATNINDGFLSAAAAFCLLPLDPPPFPEEKSQSRAAWIKEFISEGNYSYNQLISGKQNLGKIVQMLDAQVGSFRSIHEMMAAPFSSATWGEHYIENINPENAQQNLIGRINSSVQRHMKGIENFDYEPFGNPIGADYSYMHDQIAVKIRTLLDSAMNPNQAFQQEVVLVLKDLYYQFLNALECHEIEPEEDDGIVKFEFEVVTEPSNKILRVPIYTSEIYVLDDPPITPKVEISPVKGNNGKILILFEEIIGEYFAPPISIEPEDSEIFGRLGERARVEGNYNNGLLLFKTNHETIDPEITENDPERAARMVVTNRLHETYGFEIFRIGPDPTGITPVPEKYSDFSGKKIGVAKYQESLIFEDDTLLPNTKYYYTFRSVDFHGNVSNPTIVYEVELVDDYGLVYLLVKPLTILKISEAWHRSMQMIARRSHTGLPVHLPIDKYYIPPMNKYKTARQLAQIVPAIGHFNVADPTTFFGDLSVFASLGGSQGAPVGGGTDNISDFFAQWMKTQQETQIHMKLEQALAAFAAGEQWPAPILNGPGSGSPSEIYLLLLKFVEWLQSEPGGAGPAIAQTINDSLLIDAISAEEEVPAWYDQGALTITGGGLIGGEGPSLQVLEALDTFEEQQQQKKDLLGVVEKIKELAANAGEHIPKFNPELFGKKFKIRVSSKNSGKKFDLNISFPRIEIRTKDSINTDIQLKPSVPKELTSKGKQLVIVGTGRD